MTDKTPEQIEIDTLRAHNAELLADLKTAKANSKTLAAQVDSLTAKRDQAAAQVQALTIGQPVQAMAERVATLPDVFVAEFERRGWRFEHTDAGLVIRDAEGNLLLVRTRKWSGKYGIPGGKIEYGETMEAAFAREAREETGLAVRDIGFVMAQDCVEHPEFYRPRHFILVNYVARVDGIKPAVRLNHESDAYVWATPAEAMGLDLNGPTRVLLAKALGAGGKADGHP